MVLGELQAGFQLGHFQGGEDLALLLLQLIHAGLGGAIEDAGLHRFQEVGQGLLHLLEVGLEGVCIGRVGVGLHIIAVSVFCYEVHELIVKEQELGFPEDKALDPFLADIFLGAASAGAVPGILSP